MAYFAESTAAVTTLQQINDSVKRTAETFLSAKSLLMLLLVVTVSLIVGRFIAYLLRQLTHRISAQADKTNDLNRVNYLRRIETFIVLSIALIRTVLVLAAIYFWWTYTHPNSPPTAIIGGSVLIAIFATGAITPLLRDFTYGSVMMAEHWFGVGDYVRVEPFANLQGVVERVTLRSTRIRDINGEVVWVNNQNIQAIRVTPKGIRTLAIELLVNNLESGLSLIAQANLRLPNSPLMLVRPLTVITKQEVGNNLWHITAIGETAPGREWVLENYALRILQEIDEDSRRKTLLHEPIARYADADAEKRFARTINNARKRPVKRAIMTVPLPMQNRAQASKPKVQTTKTTPQTAKPKRPRKLIR